MGQTKLDMCNQALRYLGSDAIADFEESSKSGRLCRLFFDITRDTVLREYRWRCCLERAVLTADASTPAFQWDYQYHLPSDPWCLRVLQMEKKNQEFAVEGRLLLTDQTDAKILYIKRTENFGELDPFAVKVIAIQLAIEMAISLRGGDGQDIKMGLEKRLTEIVLPNAKKANSFEGLEPDWNKVNAGEWIQSRFQGRSNLTLVRPEGL